MLSVVLPIFRLADSIEGNLGAVASELDRLGIDWELVPVDDGSCDGTDEALRRAAAARPDRVRPVWIASNVGKGNALREGFAASRGELVMLLDGDLDILPSGIGRFLEEQRRTGADIVVGSKRHPESKVKYPLLRRLSSSIYYGLVKMFIGLPVTDTQTGMKLFRRKVLGDALDRMLVKTYAFDLELLSIAYGRGARIVEAPVEIRFGGTFGALQPRTVKAMLSDTAAVFYRLRVLNYYARVEVPPKAETQPSVSVIIACPGPSPMLDECLDALANQSAGNFEVIVLPDFPIEGNLPKRPYPCRFIPTGKVRPAEKRNIGIKESTGDVIAFIDDDAYPEAHWIENAIKYFGDNSVGGVGGPGVTPPNDGFLAKCGGKVYENVFVSGSYRYRYLGGRVRLDIDDYPSCNLFVRKDVLEAIGGYRTDFWPGEDTLLCEAIVHERHRRIVYDPWTIVYHHRRRLFLPHLRQLGRYGFHRGYFVKRFPVTSAKPAYFAPTAFVLYLLALAGFLVWRELAGGGTLGPVAAVAASPLFFYCLLVGLTTFSVNPVRWISVLAGVFTSHVWYGVQFARGLFASKAPCEFIGKDHLQGH